MGRTLLRSISVLIFLASQLWAQAPAATTTEAIPKFSTDSQLVLVPVMVTGKNGAHVEGLGRDAFKIEEGGKPRVVTTFEEIKPVAPGSKPQPALKLDGRSNFNFEEAPSGHMTIIVFDMLNTPYLYQGDGKRKLIEYLSKSLPPGEATVLFGLGMHGLRQLYPPTSDTAALLAALKTVTAPPGVSDSKDPLSAHDLSASELQSSFAQMSDQLAGFSGRQGPLLQAKWITLTAMTQIAHAYSSVPGRKTLLWPTSGFPFIESNSPGVTVQSLLDKYQETWRDLISADIAVYAMDVSGLAGFNGSLISYRSINHKEQTLRRFSEETGGIPCLDPGDIEHCIPRVIADSNTYYLLGYYLPNDDRKPGWRKLKVKVEAAGVHVRARDGFFVPGASDETPNERYRQLQEALISPVELTGVRLNVRQVPLRADSKPSVAGKSRHDFAVGVLGGSMTIDTLKGNAVDMSLVAVAFGANDKNGGQTEYHLLSKLPAEMLDKVRKTGLSVTQSLDLAPGHYDIKFAVRDNLNGQIGTVEYPLDVTQ